MEIVAVYRIHISDVAKDLHDDCNSDRMLHIDTVLKKIIEKREGQYFFFFN